MTTVLIVPGKQIANCPRNSFLLTLDSCVDLLKQKLIKKLETGLREVSSIAVLLGCANQKIRRVLVWPFIVLILYLASCSDAMVYPYLNQNLLLFHWKFSEEIQVQMEKICTLILHLFLLDVVEMEAVIILVNILKYLNTDGDTFY
ncbi:hypothetical protein RHMOL_Rhmol10G0043300 [Rhododendron molle]|uniref:Uncharacterized protein n=1 Tax=Rhododendron molle TaxID=49168 RepID=A0ACC0LZW1_RHOML|nr:hypothetical protein RHMOL_Rhmol10G0043300 [Rhododendron molle]